MPSTSASKRIDLPAGTINPEHACSSGHPHDDEPTASRFDAPHAIAATTDQSSHQIWTLQEHKINSQDLYTRWFVSRGGELLCEPPVAETVVYEDDLFVHHLHNLLPYEAQIWIYTRENTWKSISEGHHFPKLPSTHRLVMNDLGEPRWLTRNSVRGRLVARQKKLRLDGYRHGDMMSTGDGTSKYRATIQLAK